MRARGGAGGGEGEQTTKRGRATQRARRLPMVSSMEQSWMSSTPLMPMLKPSILMSFDVGLLVSTPVTVRMYLVTSFESWPPAPPSAFSAADAFSSSESEERFASLPPLASFLA